MATRRRNTKKASRAAIAALTNDKLLDVLHELRTLVSELEPHIAARYDEAIVELEAAAAARGLHVVPVIHEPMPITLAEHRLHLGIARQDVSMVWNTMPYLNDTGLWQAYLRRRELPPVAGEWLEDIAFQIERRLYSDDVARGKYEARRVLGLSAADYVALLEQLVALLFATHFSLIPPKEVNGTPGG